MKKIFMLLAAAATIFAVSCNRAKGPEALIEEEDNSPVAVKFSSNLAAIQGVTKAAVDEFTAEETLYIYGLEGEWNEDREFEPNGNILINNVAAVSPELAATPVENVPESRIMGAIEVWDPAYDPDKVPFFYGTNGEVYNFYGYYIGDALGQTEPAPDEDLKLTVGFNGTQDIMLAHTDSDADYDLVVDNGGTPFNINTVYSAKAARKGVQPNLIFEHQLSRFVFMLKFVELPASTKAENMTIMGITLGTPSNEVTLDIDDQDETAFTEDSEDVFDLYNVDGSLFTDAAITTDYQQAGESIMVAPGSTVYPMTVSFTYKYYPDPQNNPDYFVEIPYDGLDEEGHYPAFSWDIDLEALLTEEMKAKNNDSFEAQPGKKYIVKLIVYGPAQVEISVTLEDWDEIELSEIDPDAE